jgi:hypothetical protein
MRFDRREFMWYGASGALALGGCWRKSTTIAEPYTRVGPRPTGPLLEIDFEGLFLMEQKSNSIVLHLVDGPAVSLPPHIPQMKVVGSSVIDQTKTAEPDSAHILGTGTDKTWLWDLKGLEVKTPTSNSGEADLTSEDVTTQDGQEVPTDDAGWSSLARVPDLRVLCDATKVDPASYPSFASSITLNHGHIRALKPEGAGETAVWKCTNLAGKQLMRQAFSNKVRYTCPTQGRALTIFVGSQPIVFHPSVDAKVEVMNLPLSLNCAPNCGPLNMHHFSALVQLVDKKFTPTISLVPRPDQPGNVDPDYCPGARV